MIEIDEILDLAKSMPEPEPEPKPKKSKPDTTDLYRPGQFFLNHGKEHELYMLSIVGSYNNMDMAMIRLDGGTRYTYPVSVKNCSGITKEEFKKLSGENGNFEVIDPKRAAVIFSKIHS